MKAGVMPGLKTGVKKDVKAGSKAGVMRTPTYCLPFQVITAFIHSRMELVRALQSRSDAKSKLTLIRGVFIF